MYPCAARLFLWLLLLPLTVAAVLNKPEVAWGDWIIVDDSAPSDPGTSILLRRITPKSVFVAPSFSGCSDGYQPDNLGRCVKVVKVNQQAQWNFFLERLKTRYGPSTTSKHTQREPTGPFHINLPIGSDAETSQEEVIVKKRVPPLIRDSIKERATTIRTTMFIEPSTMMETTVTTNRPTTLLDTESTMNLKSEYITTSRLPEVEMVKDEPIRTESDGINPQTPKNQDDPTKLPEPFVIIVTNPTDITRTNTQTEEMTTYTTTPMPPLTTSFIDMTEREETISENPSTTEVTTETTIEPTTRFTTDNTQRTIQVEDLGESAQTLEPIVKPSLPLSIKSKCDQSGPLRDNSSACVTGTSQDQKTKPTVSLPASLPLLEPTTQVRFPSESNVPPRKTQAYIRFPDSGKPWDSSSRPSYWWPSWQVRQHPDIRGWPPSDTDHATSSVYHKQYHQYNPQTSGHSWTDTQGWRRKFFQRD